MRRLPRSHTKVLLLFLKRPPLPSLLFLPPGRTSTRPWHLACIGLVDFRTTFAALHPAPTQFPIFLICLCTCMCMRMHAAHAHAWTVSK